MKNKNNLELQKEIDAAYDLLTRAMDVATFFYAKHKEVLKESEFPFLPPHYEEMFNKLDDTRKEFDKVSKIRNIRNVDNITEAVNRACEEPSLLDALTWICIWESERVVKQSRSANQWETCFRVCIELVMEQYWIKNDRRINTR